MSDLDAHPAITEARPAAGEGAVLELYESRQVPLGGVRGMRVDRLLPHRSLPTVGAWCFLDRFGPQRTDMRVLPHPHTGLQTVTWPLRGRIRHRDSLGNDVLLRPGQLNLMTAGHGVSHSEFSVGEAPLLDALQLWLALPADRAAGEAGFEQHVELPVYEDGGLRATVFAGGIGGTVSPATVYTPLAGADLELAAGTATSVPLRRDFEYGLLVLSGELEVAGSRLAAGPLLYLGTGRDEVAVSAAAEARAVLLGGEPFPDDLVMWWNFVGRDHEEIAAARAGWEDGDRFGTVPGHGGERIPAPALPGVRLRPRSRRSR
ncbi:pirin family protein [Actinoallomurus acaciae]|uniref:Pirin family protein n=1 Tax=Actinoallomurus acaciae TaxID=502577 RepID=A0ABV5YSF9_9ACTN